MRVGWFRAFGTGLAEVFLLREAERVSTAYGSVALARIRAHKSDAAALLRSARRLARPGAAIAVLESAVASAAAALHAARGGEPPLDTDAEIARARDDGLVAAWRERAAVDPHNFAAMESLRDALEQLVDAILDGIESRSTLELAALRWGRSIGVILALVSFSMVWVRQHWLVHDVALNKPVLTSSLRLNPPDPAEVVDGRTRGTFGVHTNDGHPFVTVDLQRTYTVRNVRVWNRGDGWFDDILPLTLSVSVDGVRFEPVATRTAHFDVWDVPLGGRSARWVRVSKDSGYIALNEIEVLARE